MSMQDKVSRRAIGGIVILIAIILLWALVPYADIDETIPDNVALLDAQIEEFLETIEPNFQTLYEDRSGFEEYNLQYGDSKILLDKKTIYTRSVDSVVYITVMDEFDMYIGSGTILSTDGLILTNFHLVEDADKVVVTTTSGKHYAVESVVASDEELDITFLKIDAEALSPISIGNSDNLVIGDETLVIGHPEGLINSLTDGIISGIHDYSSRGAGMQLQITNPISSGNSGGALLNEYGELIGVPTWVIEYEDNIVQVQGLNFAVPINSALKLLDI